MNTAKSLDKQIVQYLPQLNVKQKKNGVNGSKNIYGRSTGLVG